MHDNDGAKERGKRWATCATCLESFPAETAAVSAALCKAHVEAGCPKARRPKGEAVSPSVAAVADLDDEDLLW